MFLAALVPVAILLLRMFRESREHVESGHFDTATPTAKSILTSKKALPVLILFLVLVAGLGTSIFLVKNQQDVVKTKAACSPAECYDSVDCGDPNEWVCLNNCCVNPNPHPRYRECSGTQCVVRDGEGEDSCWSNDDCDAPCIRNCDGKTCGDDGCGGNCGICSYGQACSPSGVCQVLPPPSTCTDVAQCGNGALECLNGHCVYPASVCQPSCGANEVCIDMRCVTSQPSCNGVYCGAGQKCVNNTCTCAITGSCGRGGCSANNSDTSAVSGTFLVCNCPDDFSGFCSACTSQSITVNPGLNNFGWTTATDCGSWQVDIDVGCYSNAASGSEDSGCGGGEAPTCNQACTGTGAGNCTGGYQCISGTCQNPSCLGDADCVCAANNAACNSVVADKALSALKPGDTVTFTGYGWVSAAADTIDLINFVITRNGVEVVDTNVAAVRAPEKDIANEYFYKANYSYVVPSAGSYQVTVRAHWVQGNVWKD